MPRTRVTYPKIMSFQATEEQKLMLLALGHFWGKSEYAHVIRYMIDNYIPQVVATMTPEQLERFNAIKRNLAIKYSLALDTVMDAPMREALTDPEPAQEPEAEFEPEPQGEMNHDEPSERTDPE